MGQEPMYLSMPEGLEELLELERLTWPARLAELHAGGALLALEGGGGGEGGGDGGGGSGGEGGGDGGAGGGAGGGGDDDDGEGEEWNEERARETIKKQRASEKAALKRAAEAEKRAKELEDAQKTEEQKREEAKATAEREASEAKAEALRLKVALRKGLTETQAKRLVGTTEEELEEDADELLSSFKPEGEDNGGKGRRPAERLRPGAAPGAEAEELDPKKLAEKIPQPY